MNELVPYEEIRKKRYRLLEITDTCHKWRKIAQTDRNSIYKCELCGELMEGNLERVLCGDDCQDEIHFCKKKLAEGNAMEIVNNFFTAHDVKP